MLDLHSHILPCMDDGSQSVDESREMILALASQGIDTVAATPHYFPQRESVDEFLDRRAAAFSKISDLQTETGVAVLPGAEVCYYEGISRLSDIERLCISGTDLLLLEMPATAWTEYKLKELTEMASRGDVTIVLAHIERYVAYQSKSVVPRLLDRGILLQMNSSYVEDFFTRKKALSMLKNGTVSFLGSDCHDMTYRRPAIGKSIEIIAKKLGDGFLADFDSYTKSFLSQTL